MAERRMFAKTIVESDAFLEMSLSAQALYFHLGMEADDDGIVANPTAIQRMIGAAPDDLKTLLAKRFILGFDSGVIVVKHWKINNYIQKDRYRPTTYIEELSTLTLDEKNAYTEAGKNAMYTDCIQNVSKMYTQDRIGKDSIYNSLSLNARVCAREEKENIGGLGECAKEYLVGVGLGEYENVYLTAEDIEELKSIDRIKWMDYVWRLSEYMATTGKAYDNHCAVIKKWMREDGYI